MFTGTVFLQILIALSLGLLIGLEREKKSLATSDKFSPAGMRSFGLTSLLGFTGAFLDSNMDTGYITIALLLAVLTLISIAYYIQYTQHKRAGITSEISLILTFIMGVLVGHGLNILAISISIITLIILSLYRQTKQFEKSINQKEFADSLKFGIIAFIILPLLPNERYGTLELFNPYHTWLMVVFVSGIGFIGYILTKIIGTEKGIGLTGLIGGLVSSTAVTTSLAQLSQKAKNMNPFVFGILISSTIMFVRVAVEIFVFNRELFSNLALPLAAMTLTGIIVSRYYGTKKDPQSSRLAQQIPISSPFALKPALFFGGFFAFIILISKLAVAYLPTSSIYIISVFSALADVDAIVLTIASMENIPQSLATNAILLTIGTNSIVKGCIVAMFGSKKLAAIIFATLIACVAAGFVTAILI